VFANLRDLEQIGYFGLIRAIERFPQPGYAFSSFAVPYRGEILHFLRDSLLKIPVAGKTSTPRAKGSQRIGFVPRPLP